MQMETIIMTMLAASYNLLVFGCMVAASISIALDYRVRRRVSTATVFCEKHVPSQSNRNGYMATAAQRIVGLSVEVAVDGAHLEFYQPPNRRGTTSPITSLVSTRQRDTDGTIYELTTASGSLYLVSMPDERARQVLGTFYAWKNGYQKDEETRKS
jgi:hypothetical protein